MTALLDIQNLSLELPVDNGWKHVLDDVSFAVNPGEIVALVGESGSGKTMTALSILDLLPGRHARREGTVLFAGRDLLQLSPRELQAIRGRDIGMVFQEPAASLHPSLTVGEQVAEVLRAHRDITRDEARNRAIELLREVRIPDPSTRAEMYPFQLSGGMQQRVMLASALACDPALLVADEPTTALDVTVQAQILDLLAAEQRKRGLAILFVTHDLALVQRFCDRVVVMFAGRVLEDRPTAELIKNPRHPYTRALLDAVPDSGNFRRTRRAIAITDSNVTTGCRFALRCPWQQPVCCETEPPLAEVADGRVRCILPQDASLDVAHDGLDQQVSYEPGDTVLLRCENLRRVFKPTGSRFGRRRHPETIAVDDVSLEVRAGQTVAIVGESGSGKSTTARMVLRLLDTSSGTVEFDGSDITALGGRPLRALRSQLQAVFQDPAGSLDPTMTVGTHLTTAIRLHQRLDRQDARKRAAELLELVGLPSTFAARYPYELSGGQRQRVVLARALSADPKLIVLDEPVSALDVSTQAQTVAMLADLQQQLGVAYLLIAHDLPLVRHLSHWVIVMYQGIVLEEGPTAQIYERPRHPYTQALLSLVASSAHPRAPIVLPGELPGASDESIGCRFRARCLYAFSECSREPPLLGFGDEGRVACHLHTTGPTLDGRSVDLLLDDAVRAVPIPVRSTTPSLVPDSTQGEP